MDDLLICKIPKAIRLSFGSRKDPTPSSYFPAQTAIYAFSPRCRHGCPGSTQFLYPMWLNCFWT